MDKSNKSSEENMSIMSESQSDEVNRKENYQKQLDKLEMNIEELKRENEDLQKKIKVIFEFRKKEGREEKNYYKDSNINESIYADSLTSAANLHNELNTHKRKLMADLEKYNQSIEIQDERKREVYKILMNYKEELLFNAEYRKGTKIPREQVDRWLEKEKDSEDNIRSLRIDNIKYTLELNRLNKELKKMEEYFEGLHLIDFEQLKIENNTLTEKIEDRNEEIHKLESKIHNNIQILAHLQQKYAFVNDEFEQRENKVKEMTSILSTKKNTLNDMKLNTEHKKKTKLQTKVKIDQINSNSLKNYYSGTNINIENLCKKIDLAIAELSKFRKQDNIKDIKLLETRKKKLLQEYKLLPKI
jgi:hypothetical protein